MKTTKQQNPYFNRWSRYLLEYGKYLKSSKEMKETTAKLLHNTMFPLRMTWNTYRTINHWSEVWLIDDNRDNWKWWRSFSYIDLIWIKIIEELRDFWMSIETIKKVKNDIYPSWNTDLKKRIRSDFEFYIVSSISTSQNIYCIAFKDWSGRFIWELDLNDLKDPLNEFNYIKISIDEIINDLFSNIDIQKLKKDKQLHPAKWKEKKLIQDILLTENDKEIVVRVKEWKVWKFKSKELKDSYSIKNIKWTNIINLIKENPNSKISISSNKTWNISAISLSK